MTKLTSPIDLIKRAITIFVKKENFLFLSKIYLPMAVFSVLSIGQSNLVNAITKSNSTWFFVGVEVVQILYLLTSVFVTVSGIIALGKVIDGGDLSLGTTYKKAWKKYWLLLLLSIILTLLYILGFVLFIIPGMLFVVWFVFSRFLAIEKNMGIRESLLKSRQLVRGVYWKILGRILIFGLFMIVVLMILSVIPYGIGSVISSFCGGLYLLPLFLLYRELSV